MRNAATRGFDMELVEGSVEVGCDCSELPEIDPLTGVPVGTPGFQLSIRQVLLIVTTVAIILTIFRHPISLLFTDRVVAWASTPWSIYGWLFFGTDIINPRPLGKDPMAIIAFLVSVIVAMLLPLAAFTGAAAMFKKLWRMAR